VSDKPPIAPDKIPHYWRDETGGELGPAMWRYLCSASLSLRDLALLHLYLRQWVDSPAWDGNPHLTEDSRKELAALRQQAAAARSRSEIDRLVNALVAFGMDPL